MRNLSIFSCLLVLFVANECARAHTATTEHNMVATVHPIATDAAVAVFHEGGNAVDAAVTAARADRGGAESGREVGPFAHRTGAAGCDGHRRERWMTG